MSNKWTLAAALPPLETGEVQLWRVDLDGITVPISRYTSLLNAAEHTHAARLRAGQTRDHFTVGRACLRILLGNTLEVDPREIGIENGAHGKPEIQAVHGHGVSFNVAHSKGTILLALNRQSAVGIDVEHIDPSTDIMEVARGNFTENESASLEAIADPELRLRTFYSYWTRKEAVGKADGRGLLLSLTSFDVASESANSQPVRVNDSTDTKEKLYFVSDLDLGKGIAGALALESSELRVKKLLFPQSAE